MATWHHAESEYQRALDVALQWFAAWHATKSQRHLDTAIICAQIARERFPIHRTDRRIDRRLSRLIVAQHQVEAAETADDIHSSLQACRLVLDGVCANQPVYEDA